MKKSKNDHNFENAGNTIGQLYNTSKYDSNYNRKKGMRFFLVVFILISITSIVFLTIRTYPIIQILYLDDSEIVVHEIKTNTFGKSRISNEIIIEYDNGDTVFRNLTEKAAQAAELISEYRPEIIAADEETLFQLTDEMYIKDIKWFINHRFEEKWLIAEAVSIGAISDIAYGVQVNESRYYPWLSEEAYIGVVKTSEEYKDEELKSLLIQEMITKIITDEPYKSGTRTSGFRIMD